MLFEPVVRLKPADGPIAILLLPLVLKKSALAPIAVLGIAGRVADERQATGGGVVGASILLGPEPGASLHRLCGVSSDYR